MWHWFDAGWIIVLPLAMMALCVLMCIFMRHRAFFGCRTCCGYKHEDSEAESKRRSEPLAPTPRA